LLGRDFSVTRQRGVPVESALAPLVVATVHPSSILRAPDERPADERAAFVADLRGVAERSRNRAGRASRPS
jgi:DNA polymerase